MDLSRLIRCLQASDELHILNAGASEEEIVSVEQELSLRLPEPMRELYRFSDGLTLFGGELSIYPLRNATNELSLSRVTPWLRECNWPIPETVLIFGATGTGDPVGLWTSPHSDRYSEPVIQVGAIFEPACMPVAASSISGLLYFVTAHGLHLHGHSSILKDVLEVAPLLDPAGFESVGDPYENPLDEEGLRKLLN